MLPIFDSPSGTVPAIVMMLVDVSLKATVVLGLAMCVAWFLRHRSAAVRHAVWNVALGGVLIIPILHLTVPAWRVAVPESWVAMARTPAIQAMPAPVLVGEVPRAIVEPAQPALEPIPMPAFHPRISGAVPAPTGIAFPSSTPAPTPDRTVGAQMRDMLAGVTWEGWLIALWWAGASLVLLLLGTGLVRVSTMSARGRPMSARAWLDLRDRIARQLEIRRPVTLLMSESATTPFTWGARRPIIVLPADAATWSHERRRQVLLHEMAHIRRNDFVTQLVARYACALYWFHPMVWAAATRLRETREQACDDVVLSSGVRPSTYAGHLLDIARSARDARTSAFASVAMARRSQLEGRLVALLDERRARRDPGGPSTAMGWAAVLALLVPLSAVRPELTPGPLPDAPVLPMGILAAEPALVAPGTPAMLEQDAPFPRESPPASTEHTPSPIVDVLVAMTIKQQENVSWASAPACTEERREGKSRGTNENHNDDAITARFWDGECEGDVRMRGTVRFADDLADVRSIARGGRFEIEIDNGDETRRIEMRSDNGSIVRRWFVGGREVAYDAAAERFLAAALSDYFRHSGFLLEERIDRLMQQGGVEAILAEARRVHGEYMMAQLFQRALASGRMSPAQIEAVVREAGTEIGSDYSLSRVLQSVPASALQDDGLRRTYVQATGRIESDYEKRQALQAILTQSDLSDQTVMDLLQTARTIDSDYELATLLHELGAQYLRTPALRTAYLETAQSIASDYELRRVLSALLESRQLENATLVTVLETSANIDSDYELAELLVQASTRFVVDDAMRTAFFRAVNTIESDYERGRVLKTLMGSQSLEQRVILDLLESAGTIDSDFQLAEVLNGAGESYLVDDTLRPAFFRAVGTIGSDFERQRVITTVAKRQGLPRPVVLDLVRAAGAIDGDFAKAASLIEIHQGYGTDDQVRTAIEEAANGISSDYEYGRVMSALRGRNARR
jgi:beta-lactamase regulating signal transducer with metallopeptidase domain